MKIVLAFLVSLSFASSAFAGPTWLCDGDTKANHIIKVMFETVSNNTIRNVVVTEEINVIARSAPSIKSDVTVSPSTNEGRNRFNISTTGGKFGLNLPIGVMQLFDDFQASLSIVRNGSTESVKLSCDEINNPNE